MRRKKMSPMAADKQEATPQATWAFNGTPEALEALCKRDQAQAEALAQAMKALQDRGAAPSNSRRERHLRRELGRLKRALHRKGRRRPRRRKR